MSTSTHMRPRRFVVIDLVSRERNGQASAICHASEGCSTRNWETSDAALDPPKDTVSLSVPQIVSNSSTILGSALASHTNCEWAKEYLRASISAGPTTQSLVRVRVLYHSQLCSRE